MGKLDGKVALITARAALFLCSDDASFITGQAVAVDGGFTAGHRLMMQPGYGGEPSRS